MSDSAEAVCCPPGSWDGPLNPLGAPAPQGSSFVLEGTDLKVYYTVPPSSPSNRSNCKKAVMVFHDVWGHLPRLLSICDTLAVQLNVHVIAPDCFRGKTKADAGDKMLEWLLAHPYDDMIATDIASCLQYLEQKGVDRRQVGAVGFCWGGWVIAKSSVAGVPWKVGVTPHPSTSIEHRVFGRDEGEMLSNVCIPFLLLPAGNDPDTVKPGHPLVQKLVENGGKSILFEDMVHGWTTRSDLSNENIRRQVEKALSLSVDFLRRHLES